MTNSLMKQTVTLEFFNGDKKSFTIKTESLKEVCLAMLILLLFISLKIGDKPIIGAKEIGMMKTGAGIINTARGGVVIDETALMFALDKEKLAYAGLDVFENEPNPIYSFICMHGAVSINPTYWCRNTRSAR